MPLSPMVTASTSLGMGSDVMTTSAPLVTSAIDLAAVAPRSVQVFSAAAFRSNTVTWWLLRLTMLRHMGPPMLPTPMKPTFTDPLLHGCDGGLYARSQTGVFRLATRRGNMARKTGRTDRPMARNKLHPIPHPPRTPVLGNMLTVDGDAPIQDLMRITREQGPIFWLDMMGTPLVVVSGADLVAELCDEKRFDKAVRGSLRRVRMLGGDALFTAETQEPNWQKAHNILLPTFAHRMMQTYHEGMLDIADQLVTKWERLNADEEIDVVRDMTALTLDTIGLCGFNYRFNSFYRSDNHPYVESLVRALEAAMKMRGLPLEDITQRKSRKKLEQDVGFMNGIADRIIRERREVPADDQTKPD